jgi:hypothetical protein
MNPTIRPFQPSDLEVLKRITAEAFGGASIDQLLEQHFGILHGHDWRWRRCATLMTMPLPTLAEFLSQRAEAR